MEGEDYADAIVSYFLTKRGKGSAESSRDQVKIEHWEAEAIALQTVLACIDLAFERSVEAPKSVSACGRWMAKAIKAGAAGEETGVAELFGVDPQQNHAPEAAASESLTDAHAGAQVADAGSPPDDLGEADYIDVLEQFAAQHHTLPTARAAQTLAAELREIVAESGVIDDETRAAMLGAWVELVLAELSSEDAKTVRLEAAADELVRTLSTLASPELVETRNLAAQARTIARLWKVPALHALFP